MALIPSTNGSMASSMLLESIPSLNSLLSSGEYANAPTRYANREKASIPSSLTEKSMGYVD